MRNGKKLLLLALLFSISHLSYTTSPVITITEKQWMSLLSISGDYQKQTTNLKSEVNNLMIEYQNLQLITEDLQNSLNQSETQLQAFQILSEESLKQITDLENSYKKSLKTITFQKTILKWGIPIALIAGIFIGLYIPTN